MADIAVAEIDPAVKAVVGQETLLMAFHRDPYVRVGAEQGADSVRGHALQLVCCTIRFHHAVKHAGMMKYVKRISLESRFEPIVDKALCSETTNSQADGGIALGLFAIQTACGLR